MMDRISSLPNYLLLHILSFLPTKQAVVTSFSSKRWRPLLHSLPTFVVHDADFCGLDAFIQDDIPIPTFYNVTHLECVTYDGWTTVVNRLQKFPKLENLLIYQLGDETPPEPILKVPTCISSHLKEFIHGDFVNSEEHFEFVRFIMENARVLRTVTVASGSQTVSDEKEILEILSSYPKDSENCCVLYDEFAACREKEWDRRWFRF
ncbi:hypothetical protein K1719_020828 [Acacia pycnantha]|nr:hypothetical protein K1719_020828 [Acacia pycnantha]